MTKVKILHPFMLQMENGEAIQFHAGGEYVPDTLMSHPLVLGNIEGGMPVDSSDASSISDEKEALRTEASHLGIAVDGRWSIERLKSEISMVASRGDEK